MTRGARRRRGPVPVAAASALLLASLAGCAPGEPEFEVLAFQPYYAGTDRIAASADAVQTVGISFVHLADEGAAVSQPSDEVLDQLAATDEVGLASMLLVTNYDADAGGFSPELARATLDSRANRESAADDLAEIVERDGWDGVMLDLESLDEEDADGLAAFAAQVREAIGDDVRLDIAIGAADRRSGYLRRGADVAALLESVDRITLMAYDLHGPWNPDDPGAVGDLDWVLACVDALLELAPADRVQLGVAAYGYRWLGPDGDGAVSPSRARTLAEDADVEPVWDEVAAEWTATLPDGTVLWWSDGRSLAERVDLARAKSLHGVAVWSLATADPLEADLVAESRERDGR